MPSLQPAFFIFTGNDTALLQRAIAKHLLGFSPTQGKWQHIVFWGEEGLDKQFWEHLTLQGLFAVPKALVLRQAQLLPAAALQELSTHLVRLAKAANSLALPLLCFEVPFEKGQPKVPVAVQNLPCFTLAQEKGWVQPIPPLDARTLPAFIKSEGAACNLALKPADVTRLAASLPPDAALVASELAKISLTADATGNLPPEAFALLDHPEELNIFALLDALQRNTNTTALWRQIIEDHANGECNIFGFLGNLTREARTLWLTLAGTPPPYLFSRLAAKKQLAQSLGFAGIARLWELAMIAQKGIKSGERSPEQAFEIVLADLTVLLHRPH